MRLRVRMPLTVTAAALRLRAAREPAEEPEPAAKRGPEVKRWAPAEP